MQVISRALIYKATCVITQLSPHFAETAGEIVFAVMFFVRSNIRPTVNGYIQPLIASTLSALNIVHHLVLGVATPRLCLLLNAASTSDIPFYVLD